MLFEPMSNPAHSDASSFSVPCKHCAALLHPQERICPFCGYDQGTAEEDEATDPGADPALSEFESADTLPPPLQDEQTLILPRRQKERAAGRAIVAATPVAVRPIPYRPPETFWQQEEPERAGPLRWVSGLAISLVAALALFALTLAVDYFYFDRRTGPGKARAFQTDITEVRRALDRGDLGAAERTLDALDSDHVDNPTLEPLREELDQRIQEQEARREQLRDAAKKASQALGLAEPGRPSPPLPSEPEKPMAAIPAATQATPPAKDQPCSEALAALALCSRDATTAP